MTKTNSNLETSIKLLNDLLSCSDQLADNLTQDQVSLHNATLGAYYLAIHDVLGDIQLLVRNKRWNNVPALARLFFETYIDFKWIDKDKGNINRLLYKSDVEEKKKIKALINGGTLKSDQRVLLDKIEKQLNQSHVSWSNTGKSSIKAKCETLGLTEEYQNIYNELCSYAHNDIKRIEQKHIHMPKQGRVVLKHDNNMDLRYLGVSLIASNLYFVDVLETIFDIFNIRAPKLMSDLEGIQNEISKMEIS